MSLVFRIKERDSFRVIGYSYQTSNEDERGVKEIPVFWQDFFRSGKLNTLIPLNNQEPIGLMGINVYNIREEDKKAFEFQIACASDSDILEGMVECQVDAYTWAIFSCNKQDVQQTMVRIVMEWLPTSDYVLVNTGYETGIIEGGAPDIEVYGEGDDVEIWIAVKSK